MKNIVIAGAGRGIGLKTAELLQNQYQLSTISRNNTVELSALKSKFYQLNLSKDNLDSLNDLPESIDGLVYCPGSINLKPFNRLSQQDFLNDFIQNVLGAVNLIQKLLPNLKRAESASIVLFSTVAAKLGMPFHTSIATSKAAIEGLAKSLAAELAPSKLRVNVIAPSLTDTPLAASLLNTDEKKEASAKRHPLQRIGTTNDMAQLVSFLLSDNSSWITGQVIAVDGGMGNLKT
jgi:NAD(P)-dependent dehydrogenase (short-subunit alcohol dehydrogenase family)